MGISDFVGYVANFEHFYAKFDFRVQGKLVKLCFSDVDFGVQG